MAYTRKKICSAAGCGGYALPNSAYCEKHQKDRNRNTTSAYVFFYKTTWWKKAREQFLLSHIWCEECEKQGRHTLSEVVHHSAGFADWQSFCDISKWEAVCSSCHSKIHIKINNEELYNQNKDKW